MRVLVLLLLGCAHAAPAIVTEPAPLPVEQPVAPPASAPAAARAPGTIARAELLSVLNASPARFLQRVDSEPRLEKGRFTGWRINAFFQGDSRFNEVDLHPGDIVLTVNGSALEKPDHFLEVWNALKTSSELTVDLERDGARKRLHWKIID